jgi:hypothetical protein
MAKKKKREKRLTKRERQARDGKGPSGHEGAHIHCVGCGRHLDAAEFTANPSTARWLVCQHQSKFASCTGCVEESQRRLDEHDRLGRPVQMAPAFH